MQCRCSQTVLNAAETHFEDHVARLQRYLRQPSVSAEARGNAEMAAILAEDIRTFGGTARVVPGVDFPIVHGEINSGARRTVLIHSMYDTTPATEPAWVVPPFEARRMEFENYGSASSRAARRTRRVLSRPSSP